MWPARVMAGRIWPSPGFEFPIGFTTEFGVESSAIVESWVQGGPVVEEEVSCGHAGLQCSMGDDAEQIFGNVRFQGHQNFHQLAVVS